MLPAAGEVGTQGSLHPGNGTCKSSFKDNSSRGVGFYILFLQMGSEKGSAEVPQGLRNVLALDFRSGHDLGVVGSSPVPGCMLGGAPA